MKLSMHLAIAASALLAAGPIAAKTVSSQEQLARITAGRSPQAPIDCIALRDIRSSEIISRTAIVYRLNNGTVMVNRPPVGAISLSRGDVLVTDTRSPELCSIDSVRLLDSGSRTSRGSVGLGKFVPYPKPSHHR